MLNNRKKSKPNKLTRHNVFTAIVIAIIGLGALLTIGMAAVNFSMYRSTINAADRTEETITREISQSNHRLGLYASAVVNAFSVPDDRKKEATDAVKMAMCGLSDNLSDYLSMPEGISAAEKELIEKRLASILSDSRQYIEMSQRSLNNELTSYENSINSVWSGLILKIGGYPKINLAEYRTNSLLMCQLSSK